MYRRIDTYVPSRDYMFFPAGDIMNKHGLKAPRLRLQRGCPKVKFFFTEEGWDQVGRHLLREAQAYGLGVRVLAIKENMVDVVYRDRLQVAGRLRKEKRSDRYENL